MNEDEGGFSSFQRIKAIRDGFGTLRAANNDFDFSRIKIGMSKNKVFGELAIFGADHQNTDITLRMSDEASQ